ncbi:alpha/beta hydrolase [Streptomyces sp. URMC 124]|uniref:alpha/beta hydrolase n=1 Tax=Streptomyces sp. URMC 124 TaxID=3423405 RepID=UPI003F1C49A6
MRCRRACRWAAGVTVAVVLLAGGRPAAPAPHRLRWGPCPAQVAAPAGSGLQCSTVRVPLDYAQPAGRSITLGVSRLAATGPGPRRGVLLLNPGGPGGPGTPMPLWFAAHVPASVRAAYDLIGFDTRGLFTSTPVSCRLSAAQLRHAPVSMPLPDKPFAATAELHRSIARSCARHAGDLLPTMHTANAARDMDRIRRALGEQRISYYGVSYGAHLGAVYAAAFPGRTDRVVLDSAPDARAGWWKALRAFGPGSQQRFPDLTAYVAERDAVYHLGATADEVSETYARLLTETAARPRDVGHYTVDDNVLRQITLQALFADAFFPQLADVWRYLARAPQAPGEAGAEHALAPLQAAVPLEPRVQQMVLPTMLAVLCQDTPWPRSVETYRRAQQHDAWRYPVAGAMTGNIWPCAFWPYRPAEPAGRIGDRGPRNILMLQNRRDPATPYAGARAVRKALGRRAVMVDAARGGHGVYGFTAEPCAGGAATAWLTRGTLPRTDLSCPARRTGERR